MIFYFSATGNCKYVATKIANKTNDRIISIAECIKNNNFLFEVQKDENIGIIVPTYVLGLPIIVCDFLRKLELQIKEKNYVFFVATYGTSPGQTGYFANRFFKDKYYSINAFFSVKMPDTWTPIFDLSNKEKVKKINVKAETQIDAILKRIVSKETGDFMQSKLPLFLAKFYYKTYDKMRKTSNFWLTETCVRCGLCAKNCPINAIEMQNRTPIWTQEKCVMCLGCLHHCPTFAIQYGKNTKKHGQYTNPNV